jgi:NAD(P)-dependent dehydrogenase (short-subunit alcohol dehydrogenase family)
MSIPFQRRQISTMKYQAMENRVALITGASRGLGATLAEFFASQDRNLVLTARGADALGETARAVERFGTHVAAIPGDVADAAHRRRLIEAAWDLGGLDLLVNNASELGPTPLPPLVQVPAAALERVMAVNLIAPLALVQDAQQLLERNHGMVINVSSDAALGGYPGWGVYGASKAALDLLTLTLANELKDRGIAVVSVDPGDMRTRMHQEAFSGEDISDRPLPEVTVPFWAWLLGQERARVSGQRFRAQADCWEVAA